ncbi:hypothetical protein BMS3Abin07_01752 [bacterium BMS3Abin07]|nr:hypothetical protein BMS3Abin07_01752 [bacterium BMS3Abin07]GBE32704.1 hypothetical protein BMS3Bbin05_01621 [bacterium BMS3Bbin05]HDO22070.1 hypothetical protein [Nitrospirota bacterium]HDZ87680.1 hypothetical protein [Nitrospirota bacterium]
MNNHDSVIVKKLLLFLPFFFLLSILMLPSLYAEESPFAGGGYLKNFLIYSDNGDTGFNTLARLRLRLDYEPSDTFSGELAYEIMPQYRGHAGNPEYSVIQAPDPFSYRAFDLDERLYPGTGDPDRHLTVTQNLDRAYLTISRRAFDLYIGRQPVAFGAAHVINPTDIIAPFTYNTIAREERAGADAVRLKLPTGRMGEIDIGIVFGDRFKYSNSAAFLRLKSYILKTDSTVMAMIFRKNVLLGLDLSRSIGGAGTWLETAYVFPYKGSNENYIRLSAGSDYSFTDNLYAYIEYHYNSAGRSDTVDYFKVLNTTAYTEGSVYLLARHYLAPGFRYQISPLLTFTGQALINLNDGSVLISPLFEYSLADDTFLVSGAYIGTGEDSSDGFAPGSEFGLYPDVYFVSLNVYF